MSIAPGDRSQGLPQVVSPDPPPEKIGGYRIRGLLGKGGMGIVYEAEQQNPSRRVALKVMHRGHLVDEVHTRLFQLEAETLGRLKHPNIAAIYESGHTDDGHDYFAMELVRGDTLDTWLAKRPALVTQDELELRLRLFCAIAKGVHYAHQRGVIHRDLKPTNIMVKDAGQTTSHATTELTVPAVKILDFGLARITDHDVAPSMLTEFGQIKGTVPYMSPEQALGHPDEVDIRTDVYALGVILYELLSGKRPYDTARAALVEALRVVCEEPPRPLRESWNGVRRLDVDIETIVGKALEKEAWRRYASVAAIADDVDRYLLSQPIAARPPSALYQIRKFASRNRGLVGGAVGALLVVIVFAATSMVQSARVQREAARANREAAVALEVTEFMISLFDRSDPTIAQGKDPTARQLLAAGAARIDALSNEPRTQAKFMETIGRVYSVLGAFDLADPLLKRAVSIREGEAGDQVALAESLRHLASLHDAAGRYEEAEPLIRRAVAIDERLLGEGRELATALNTLGNVLWHLGRMDEAEVVHRSALEMRNRVLPVNDAEIGQSYHNLGALRYLAGDLAEAERLYRRAIEIDEAALGPEDFGLATSLHTLAIVFQDQERFDEALTLEQRSLAIREKVLGPEHWHVALSLTTLGNILRGLDRPAEGEPAIRRAIRIAEAAWGTAHGEVWWMRRSLARTLIALTRFDDAQDELEALATIVENEGDVEELAGVFELRGELEAARGRFDVAEEHYRRAIAMLADESPEDPFTGLATAGLARVLRDAGRTEDAVIAFREAIRLMSAEWGTDDVDLQRAQRELDALGR